MSAVLYGLALNFVGSIIIAFPDFPVLNKYMTPKELREVLSRLEDRKTVKKGDVGFSKLISVVEVITPRLEEDKECLAVSLGPTPYGNPKLKGDFGHSSSPSPRSDLVEWRIVKQEVKERRDIFRYCGLILFLLGFVLQALPHLSFLF